MWMFLSFAFLLLFLASGTEGETFASVPLYISGEPEGILSIDSPSGSNVESVVIASNEQDQQGVFKEIGRWSTGSLDVSSNISGDWSGNAWVSSNRDATVNIRYTIIQDGNNLDNRFACLFIFTSRSSFLKDINTPKNGNARPRTYVTQFLCEYLIF